MIVPITIGIGCFCAALCILLPALMWKGAPFHPSVKPKCKPEEVRRPVRTTQEVDRPQQADRFAELLEQFPKPLPRLIHIRPTGMKRWLCDATLPGYDHDYYIINLIRLEDGTFVSKLYEPFVVGDEHLCPACVELRNRLLSYKP